MSPQRASHPQQTIAVLLTTALLPMCGGPPHESEYADSVAAASTPLPDLVVTSLSYASGVFTSTVENQGTAAVPSRRIIEVGYRVDGVLKSRGYKPGPLAAGVSVTISADGGAYAVPAGTHTVMASVDDLNWIAESNGSNNSLSKSITIGGGGAGGTAGGGGVGGTAGGGGAGGAGGAPSSPGPADYVPQVAGVVNVKNFGAKGDGVTDDTAAINNAIRQSLGPGTLPNYQTLYFPNGTYLVSNRIETKGTDGNWRCGVAFQGETRDGAVIKLKNGASGYTSASSPKAVLYNASCLIAETPNGGGKDYYGKGEGNEAYQNDVINLTVNTGAGNPGAIGIDYIANNKGTIENVRIVSADGQGVAGLAMTRLWPGPSLVLELTVEGFNYAIQMAQYQMQVTFEHLTVKNQKIAGLYNDRNVISVRDLMSTNSVPAVRSTGSTGHVVLVDATLSGGSASVSAIENSGGTQLFARNITTSGYNSAIVNHGSIVPGSSVTEFVSGTKTSLFTSPATSMNLPIQETPEYTNSNPADWVSVTAYGATPNGGGDDTAGIQGAIDSGKPVVYLPKGNYTTSAPLIVRGNVRKIIGISSVHISGSSWLFRTGTLNNSFVVIENMTNIIYEHAGPQTLVLKRVGTGGGATSRTISGAGPLHLQEYCCGKLQVNGTQVWARHLNSETAGTRITNNGGQLWVLGLKTEGLETIIETKGGGKTEVLGGFGSPWNASSLPAFINTDSHHSIVFSTVSYSPGFSTFVQETKGGVTKTLPASSLPPRGSGRFVPLHAGH